MLHNKSMVMIRISETLFEKARTHMHFNFEDIGSFTTCMKRKNTEFDVSSECDSF